VKTKLFALAIFSAFLLIGCEKEEESLINVSQIPSDIQIFVSTYFSEQTIVRAIKETEGSAQTIDLYLDNLTKLEFNRTNQIVDIEGQAKIPDSLIQENILIYVGLTYPDYYITGWELEDSHQQIQLNNGIEIEFNLNGNFLRID
jgi:hypothetical protein